MVTVIFLGRGDGEEERILKALKERKLQMIRDGEIETGQMIVPVTYEILRIQEDGQLV